MSADRTPNPAVLATKLASLTAILAIIVGVMVLAGWAFDIAVLKSILPGWIAMKANTAACFILIGIALWLTACPPTTFNPRISTFFARFCGLLAGLIGLLTLGEYIFGWNPGLDQWLFREPDGALGTSNRGRMAPVTALCFVMLAAASRITGSSRKTLWTVLAPLVLGLLVAIIALTAMLSYVIPSFGAYGWGGLTIMAKHTAMLCAMLGMAVIAISWQQDVLRWSLGRGATAAFVCGMAVLVLIGLNISWSQSWLGEISRKIAYSEETQDDIDNILVEIIDAQAHTRGYIITGDEQFNAHYIIAKANSNVRLDALRKRIADNPHQQQFTLIEAQAKAQLQWFQQVIDARQTRMADATRNNMIRHGEGLLDNFRITYDQIKSEHQQFINELKQESKSVARFSYITIAAGTLASLLIFLTVMFKLNFAVNERKQKGRALQESEEKFRKITESAQDAIIIMGADQDISFWNAAAARIFGYTAAEAIGQELHALIAPAPAHAKFLQAFPHFQETGEEPIIGKMRELTALRKGGEEILVELSTSATKFGGQWHAIGIVRDITERRQAEESLKNMTARYHTMFEMSSDAIMLLDEKSFLDCNPATLRMFGCTTRDDFISKHPAEFSPPTQPGGEDSMSLANQHIATAFKNDNNLFEWMHRRSNGMEFPAEVLLTALELNGKPVLQATVRDITERKQTEDKLRDSKEKFSRIFESNPAMVAIGTLDGKMVDVNLSYADFLGFSRKEMLGKSLADLGIISAEELQRLLELGKRSGASLRNVEVSLRARGGNILNALLSADLVLLGGVLYRLATLQDITARKQAETQIAAQLDELRRWHKATSGREGRILDLKHEINELLGKSSLPPRYPSAESQDQTEK